MNDTSANLDYRSLMQSALLELKTMRSRLNELERAKAEPIAIIGLGCRFPGGANNPATFWQLLLAGVDAITEVPGDRWDVDRLYDPNLDAPGKVSTRYGGFIDQLREFDSYFFDIAPREAVSLDPQQRLLLEVSWEALEHGGLAPHQLAGSKTGVFIGICSNDYLQNLLARDLTEIDAYMASGNAHSVASGRLSYLLGLQGPSLSVDTACSSSLVTVHLACQSLRNRECDLALAGGVNQLLAPETSINHSRARMLAPDGRCKAFDAAADGFVRSEGCGVVVLKRASKALADGDNILALIRGSAINQDGRSSGLTVPNGLAQQRVIRQALENANLEAARISYIEAHGTGTALGDPIEVGALGAIFGKDRSPDHPLLIGSVKTNLGHLEAAAGVAGLIKVVLSLQHKEIPAHLHFNQPSPHIAWSELPITVATERIPWTTASGQRIAGVSSFGFSGTNAHMILEEAPAAAPASNPVDRPRHLLALSAKSPAALRQLAERYARHLAAAPALPLADLCFTANTGRTHFPQRRALVSASTEDLAWQLHALATAAEAPGSAPSAPPKVTMLCTGQGAQYPGMGRELYETLPTFRACLEECEALLRPELEHSLLEVLYPPDGTPALLDQTRYTQPALFALEYALCQVWRAWGIEPAGGLLGHSVGEYVAACVAGVFSLADGLKLIAARGRLMQALPGGGGMLAVNAPADRLAELIAPDPAVAVAAINGPEHRVLSGPLPALAAITATLAAAGIDCRPLNVSHAFHSPLMQPMLQAFREVARSIPYAPPRLPLISTLTGQPIGAEVATADYWCRQVLAPVQFADSVRMAVRQGSDSLLEIGPKPTLLGLGRTCLTPVQAEPLAWLPSLQPPHSDWSVMLATLARLYERGAPVNWTGFDRDYQRRRLALPTYPFQRQRYWIERAQTPAQAPHGHPAGPAPSPRLAWLQQGDIAQLTRHLQETEALSAAEQTLLPKLLGLLTQSPEPSAAPHPEWLYQVDWQPRAALAPEALPSPVACLAARQPHFAALLSQPALAAYPELLSGLESLSLHYVLEAFAELQCEFLPGQRFTTASLAEALGIVLGYRRLLHRLLEMLAEEGVLQPLDGHWEVRQSPGPADPHTLRQALLARYPIAGAELRLLERCGTRLAAVLRGACDPLELLFPGGDFSTVTQLYQSSPIAETFNTLARQAVLGAIEALSPERPPRILEIGAGTGSATAHLLPHLPPQTEYVFTDISAVFLSHARAKFAAYPGVRYQVLDIEQDPAAQGFARHRFDLVIAANVLHATQQVARTLAHVRQLLAPGGWLVLLEGTGRVRWADLTFGLTDGWWRFADLALRADYPLLSSAAWQRELQRCGFEAVVSVPETPEQQRGLYQQAMIVAQAAGVPQDAKATEAAGGWLILADRGGVGRRLAERLRAHGQPCTLAFPGTAYASAGPDEILVDPARPADFERLLQERGGGAPRWHGLVQLWGLDVPAADTEGFEALPAAQWLCGSTLHLVQAVLQQCGSQPPGLWLVTRGAVAAGSAEDLSGVAQSPLWGLGRVIRLEHPEFRCRHIDLDPQSHRPEEHAEALWAELRQSDDEDQVALRPPHRYGARLVRHRPAPGPAVPLRFREEGSYLITGGLGGLGLAVAQWMVERGARHLVLLGRTPPGPLAQARLERLTRDGAQVRLVQADVSDRDALAGVFATLAEDHPPLRGVIHSAGVLADGVVRHQHWAGLAEVLAPKVTGAWHLHRLTQALPLDFFVLFSGVASLLGSPGQSNHAAANAFLDALAAFRRRQGLPGLSINWGAWSEIGAAAERQVETRIRLRGLDPIAPAQGLDIFGYLLTQPASQVGVTPIDWSVFAQRFPLGSEPALIRDLTNRERQQDQAVLFASSPHERLQRLKEAIPDARYSLLLADIQERVANTLGLTTAQVDNHRPLNYIGLDSLMAVELRNWIRGELAVDVPIGTFMEGLSIKDLAVLVSKQLATADASSQVQSAPSPLSSVAHAVSPDDRQSMPLMEKQAVITSEAAKQLLEKLDQFDDKEVDDLLRSMLGAAEGLR